MNELARVEAADVGGLRLVRVSGEIDLSNAGQVMDAIAAVAPNDAPSVILDLTATTYVDSAGIGMLFRLAERLGYRRQALHLVVPEEAPIRAVLELTNVDRVIHIQEAVDNTPEPT